MELIGLVRLVVYAEEDEDECDNLDEHCDMMGPIVGLIKQGNFSYGASHPRIRRCTGLTLVI